MINSIHLWIHMLVNSTICTLIYLKYVINVLQFVFLSSHQWLIPLVVLKYISFLAYTSLAWPYKKEMHTVTFSRSVCLVVSIKVSKSAKIRNWYNQVPHLTQNTNCNMILVCCQNIYTCTLHEKSGQIQQVSNFCMHLFNPTFRISFRLHVCYWILFLCFIVLYQDCSSLWGTGLSVFCHQLQGWGMKPGRSNSVYLLMEVILLIKHSVSFKMTSTLFFDNLQTVC